MKILRTYNEYLKYKMLPKSDEDILNDNENKKGMIKIIPF